MMTLLCTLVAPLPVLWMLVSGQLLGARGAVIPGLSACGLSDRAVRRAWAALGQGDWACERLLARWRVLVVAEGRWQPHTHGGYRPVAVDVTACRHLRLQGCPTIHYHAEAGRALPAIPLGLIARVGSVGSQRLALPLAVVRPEVNDPRPPHAGTPVGARGGPPVRRGRGVGARRRLRIGAAAGGGSYPLRGALCQEQHLPPLYPTALAVCRREAGSPSRARWYSRKHE